MPLQRVVERDALADEPLAMIDQQPQVELRALQLRRRQRSSPSRSAARATAIASMLSDLPRSRARRRESAISFVVHAHDPLAARDQKPLEGARDVPAVLQRPHPLAAEPARPRNKRGEALGADLRPSARRAARRSPPTTAAIVCERL